MVLYHWLNYFIGVQWPYYRYLRFLTPSFIFITGFMISNVYLMKYDVDDPRLIKRLLTRGLKLIAIFVVLNILRNNLLAVLAPAGAFRSPLYFDSLFLSTFVTCSFTTKVVAFYILVPIAYLLILAGALMVPLRVYRYSFHIACICLFVSIAGLDLAGGNNPNLEMVAVGAVGILAGFSPLSVINTLVRHPSVLMPLYILYSIAITAWNVPYPLEVAGTVLSVTILYLIGNTYATTNRFSDELILIGKYSLFGYISQIVVLQTLAIALRYFNLRSTAAVISFPAAFALTIISVESVHWARKRFLSMDRMYKAVFN